MFGPTKAGAGPSQLRVPLARLLALVLAFALLAASGARAQQPEVEPRLDAWAAQAERAEALIADDDTPTAELEALREVLARQRSEALAVEQAAAPEIKELQDRLAALGPAPAEGAEEAPQIAGQRRALNEEIARKQAPVLAAQEARQRADGLIGNIDRVVRARFSAELKSRGPSPLMPQRWADAFDEVATHTQGAVGDFATALESPIRRAAVLRQLPVSLILVASGIAIAFWLHRWLREWAERKLGRPGRRRSDAALVALRNLTPLIAPVVGAGLLFAALDPDTLMGASRRTQLFVLPPFVLALIGTGWLGRSLFSPTLPAYRLLPLDDRQATSAMHLLHALGAVYALQLLVGQVMAGWEVSPPTLAALNLPLILIGGVLLWRFATVLATIRANMVLADEAAGEEHTLRLQFYGLATRVLRVFALAGPALAALGYFALGRFVVFPTILTIGLFGAALVIFDVLNKTAIFFFRGSTAPGDSDDGGLMPVAVGTLVTLAAIPLFLLIWGARPADLAEVWATLRDGVTFGGMRISASVIVTFAIVFGIGAALTRLMQALLRGSVLPRTRLDTGGKNAVLAGVGYVGFFIAALAAIAATGLDLSNIAIVAGALSVGIGFGLQNIVSNFVSGIILLVERPIKEGDWIEVGAYSGYVRGISVRSTEIETFDQASVILPNSDLVAGTVLNWTHAGTSGRLRVPVGVAYGTDPRKVEEILMTIAEGHPMVLIDPGPRVLFMGFGPDAMNFEIRCFLRDVNYMLSTLSDMNFEIVAKFGAEGIKIPAPQREVNLRNLDQIVAALRQPGPVEPAAEAVAEPGAGAVPARFGTADQA